MSNDERLESLLRQYRPCSPSSHFREHVLEERSPVVEIRPVARWIAIAAMLVASVALDQVAEVMNRDTGRMVGVGTVRWTVEAEEEAVSLGGGSSARMYLAMHLAAGDLSGGIASQPVNGF